MNLNVDSTNSDGPVIESVETVEVVSGSENVLGPVTTDAASKIASSSHLSVPSSGVIEIDPQALTYTLVEMANQQLTHGAAGILPSSLPSSIGDASLVAGMKRPLMSDAIGGDFSDDVPRKKSRNYLDSHKNIEKKRRDRINTGLALLKEMVPECKQYGSKKLDKAEIIEFTIQYIKRIQSQGSGRPGDFDPAAAQREWANDLMTWVFQNKLIYNGPNALEQFSNALLLNLQSYGNPPPPQSSLGSPSNVLLNQSVGGNTSSDDESLLRGQNTLIQQLLSSIGHLSNEASSGKPDSMPNQQLAQLQALLLLQQQQLLGQQHNPDGGGATNGTLPEDTTHQLNQLQQLHTLLLQHMTADQRPTSAEDMTDTTPTVSDSLVEGGASNTAVAELGLSTANITSVADSIDRSSAYTTGGTLEETLLTSAGSAQSQMWSGNQAGSSILLGGDGVDEHTIENEAIDGEVELLSSGTQQDN